VGEGMANPSTPERLYQYVPVYHTTPLDQYVPVYHIFDVLTAVMLKVQIFYDVIPFGRIVEP
jgi:hypothetical protein